MATIRPVSASVFDRPQPQARPVSPRETKRQALERVLQRAIRRAHKDGQAVYRLILDADEKASTVKAAFKRTKARFGGDGVNLLTVGDHLYVAKRPQRRGRRAPRVS